MPSENPENEMLLTPIEVVIQVDYNPASDDIRNFADYIMELDPDNNSFYFIYRFELDKDLLRKSLDSEYEKLHNRFDKLVGDDDKDADGIRIIKEMLIQMYTDSCKDAAYFSDKTYSNIVPMDMASFRALFNYQNIMAGRTLDDGNSDRAKILSKSMIDIASQEDNWKTLIQSLPDKIKQSIEDEQIQQEVRKASVETLGKTIEQISKTNGGQAGNITIDMVVTDEAVQSLLKSITSAKYQVDNFFLRESSQGLGYSNLIFIHLQLEKYRKTIDPLLVNLFVIEEPEAHMHPQMQNVFSQYLFAYYSKESAMQGFVTTHSHEVVRNSRISQLRVLRQVRPFECCLYDLHKFIDEVIKPNQELKDLIEFYDGFYAINFPDIIFADKVILYEGDTERMLIKNVLLSERFETLRNQYICFSLPQFPLREVFTFSMALDRVCVELSGRKFALPLRVGTGEVNAHILHPDEIGVRFCTAVLTWNDALIQHPFCLALGDMKQFIKLFLGDDLGIHFPFPPLCFFRVTMPWFLQVQLWRSHPGAHRCPL